MIVQQLVLQVILILLNAFFAATEIAVLSLNIMQLEKQAENKDKTAIRLLKLLEEPSSFLSTIQVGITLAGFLGSAFAADNFSGYLVDWIYYDIGFTQLSLGTLDAISVIVITIILSYFTLIFGELVPKRIAMQKPYEVSKFSCGVVLAVAYIVKPVVKFLSLSTNIVLTLLRLKTNEDEEKISEEEILLMVDQGKKHGVVDDDESEWIHNVFEFDDTCVREIMVRSVDVVGIDVESSQQDIIQTIQKTGLSRYPVYEKDLNHIIGILHVRDYLLQANLQKEIDIRSLLLPTYFIPESMIAANLFQDMQSKNIHFAVAIDEFGEVSGIITLEDLVEEIVGNIYDEYDQQESNYIEKIDDGHWKVNGNCDIKTFIEETGLNIDKEFDFDTIGGLVFSRLHTIPQDGSTLTIEIDGLSFHVTKIEKRRIKEVYIKKL